MYKQKFSEFGVWHECDNLCIWKEQHKFDEKKMFCQCSVYVLYELYRTSMKTGPKYGICCEKHVIFELVFLFDNVVYINKMSSRTHMACSRYCPMEMPLFSIHLDQYLDKVASSAHMLQSWILNAPLKSVLNTFKL